MVNGKEISLREWKEKFLNGDFKPQNRKAQCQAGWYDWFCKDESLAKKTEFLGNKAIQLFGSKKIDLNNHYIWFKNNCPAVGPLYDDFRIADIESGNVQFTICNIKKGCYGQDFSGWEVWDYSKSGEGSYATRKPVIRGTWRDVKKYFEV